MSARMKPSVSACVQPLKPGATAEEARLHGVGERYVSNLLTAIDSNVKLGEWKAAKRQAVVLLDLQHLLLPPVARSLMERLRLAEMVSAGLMRKAHCLSGKTSWVFDDSDEEDEDEKEPICGVQDDRRSICPLVRTPRDLLDAALRLARVTEHDVVADLGCGDGRMLLRVARLGARAVGFDVNPWCLTRARVAAERAGVSDRVEVVDADFLLLGGHPRFQAATVLYVYAIPRVIQRLRPLLRDAVAAGKRVVIYCTSGASAVPGNLLGDETLPAAEAMGGRLRLYSAATRGE